MTIEEILKNAGIEADAEQLAKIAEAMPKAYLPLAEHNKRIGAAKKATDDLQASFDAYKADVEKAAEEAKKNGEDGANALQELQAKYDDLEGKFTASQEAIKQRDATAALEAAFKAAGANPAAIGLLAGNAISRVEFDEDGKPSNIDQVAEDAKAANEGLFGEPFDTGSKQAKADEKNDIADAFDEGFGDTTRN